jgi:hypothetical protein
MGSMDWIRMAYRAAERGVWTPVKKIISVPLARAAQLNIFTLNRKDRLSVAG